jgi:ribosomal protein S19|tara:strand:- start:3 stop:227 length:225 start_codon:yes stop_codon:yes gene_type:complete
MKRSKWKSTKLNYKENSNMLRRDTIIDPSMVNKEFKVHTGNSFKLIKITTDHVSHRLGEFAPTKVKAVFKKSKK